METTSKTFWQTACELKIGPVPAPVYLVLAVIVAAATIFGQRPGHSVDLYSVSNGLLRPLEQ